MIFDGAAVKDNGFSQSDLFAEVLLSVWREVCRHTDIDGSTRTIAGLLTTHMPVAQVVLRRLDISHSCLETAALGIPVPEYLVPEKRSECSEPQLRELLNWAAGGEVSRQSADRDGDVPWGTLIPHDLHGDVLAGPLGGGQEPSGVLLLVAQRGTVFQESHRRAMEALLEPFSAALDNDRRLREMAAMQAATEADKNSLLMRLGRKELGDTVVGAESGLKTVLRARRIGGPLRCPGPPDG